ncbi:substrate-binding periplasmic protein [Gordonia metallireducens]|uniref:substrate-binding periplasmic protein n=1 Tax=Gordonia metallireducens TaxID=2897779 RepID=UPI001E4662DE|nr:transporter substrate-binding domain-containing protein [Gordonia metallireducens]
MRKLPLRALVTVFGGVLALSACATTDEGNGDVVTVATSANYAPFTMVETSGDLTGYAIDIAEEMGERMGATVKFEKVDYKSLLQGVTTGRYDMSDGSVVFTEERAKQLDYTHPVASSGSVAMVRAADKAKITGLDSSLAGLRIGAVDGSVQQQWALANKADLGYSDLVAYAGPSQAILDLKNGRIDAIVYDTINALYYAQKNPADGVAPVGDSVNPSIVAATTKKGNTELLDRVNKALTEMYSDGTIGSLQMEWFGQALPTPTSLDAANPFPVAPTKSDQ